MAKIQRAVVSVSNKDGVVPFASEIAKHGIEILSTGGTAKALADAGVAVTKVSEVTGFPEILGGRVKTLHPKIHGGILGRPSLASDAAELEREGIVPIGLVVVNLYPFESTIARDDVTLAEAVEQIDIGGPTMVRASAKNHAHVAIVVDPADYGVVLAEIAETGEVSGATRGRLAAKAFAHTAAYDRAITTYLSGQTDGASDVDASDAFPAHTQIKLEKVQDLRYGENPHQAAALYRLPTSSAGSLAGAEQLQGKELSFNNLIDIEAALRIARDFEDPTAVVIKHTNPCGVARHATSLEQAYREARRTDPDSAFGGIIGANREVDGDTARAITEAFVECIIAPSYSAEAREIFQSKKSLRNIRLIQIDFEDDGRNPWDVKPISGGILLQHVDRGGLDDCELRVATRRPPTDDEWAALRFAWRVAKHVKSNAIVYCERDRTVGVGAGQMSRVDSSRIAVSKARDPIQGTAMASDAFFPFRDGIDAAAEAGATAIIQPGGSIRDDEVVAAADEHDMAMVFTGMRHFKH